MQTAKSANRPIEFRNASVDTAVAILREIRPHLLADELHKMLGGMPDFFSGEAAILDFSEVGEIVGPVDWSGLLTMFRRFQLQPIGIRNMRQAELASSARQAGLAILDGMPAGEKRVELPVQPAPEPAPRAQPEPQPAAPAPMSSATTMFVDRPVRSGQQIYARGGDLVLLAGMSNGAEIIADGSIHCYGPLRGRALAGAQGSTVARIIATNFGPEIVSIAGVYRTFEQGLPAEVAGKPAYVRLTSSANEQKLGIEPLQLD